MLLWNLFFNGPTLAPKLDQARLGPSGTMDRLDKPNHVMCNK